MAAIRHYYGYCQEEPPAIPSWRVDKEPPRYIGEDETATWLSEIRKLSAREYAAACLMYSAGLRAGELVDLELEQLDLDNRSLRVRGKGAKVRQVPFDEQVALPALLGYLQWVRPALECGENMQYMRSVYGHSRGDLRGLVPGD
jgi:site-specific recombinase XerC